MSAVAAEKLLGLVKKKTNQAEVVFSSAFFHSVSFRDDQLKDIEADFSSSIGLRLIYKGKIGVAVTNRLDKLEKLVDKAMAVSQFGPKAYFEFPKPVQLKNPKIFDLELKKISDRVLVKRGEEIIEKIKSFNPKITVDLGFEIGEGESFLLNSSGLGVSKKGGEIDFGIGAKVVKEGDFLQITEGDSSRRDDLNIDFYLKRLIGKFKMAKETVEIKSGCYPILFTPMSFAAVLDDVFTALSGRVVLKGSSRLQGKLGQRVFDPRITIVDDGTLDWRTKSIGCDSEGIPTSRLTLIEDGLVKNFYYDLQTATQAKTKSTGHGKRSKESALATPSLYNIVVYKGKKSYDSMLRKIKLGILAEDFIGVGQDNPLSGDFSMNLALGYKIENGEIVGRIKDTMIAGNIFDLLKDKVLAISKEREWVDNSFCCPYFLLDGISVASKNQLSFK